MNENSFRFLSAMSEIEEHFIAEASDYPPAGFHRPQKQFLRFLLAAALILSLCGMRRILLPLCPATTAVCLTTTTR